jgi:hypothetical protein
MFRIAVPVQKEGFRILLNAAWVLVLAATVAVVLTIEPRASKGSLRNPILPAPWVFAALLIILGGIPILLRLAWYLFGREDFEVRGRTLHVRRGIGPWGVRKQFDLGAIRNVHVSRLRYSIVYPVWGRPFVAHEPFEVVFDYGSRAEHYVRGAQRDQAEAVVAMIHDARLAGVGSPSPAHP